MSGKFWITSSKFDINKVSFSAPVDIGNKYTRYNVRYLYDNDSIRNLTLTTGGKDILMTCTGVYPEQGQFAKEHSYQSTLVTEKDTADMYSAIVDIVKKFKSEIIPNGELKCPVKELDDGTTKLYTKLIQSNDGNVYTVFTDKDNEAIDVKELATSFKCRPCIAINFVLDRGIRASMKLQMTRVYVSDMEEKVEANLSEMD